MATTADPTGLYVCPLSGAHKAALLAEQAGPLSALQQEVARQYLDSVTWTLRLRADGTLEHAWDVGHGASPRPLPGTWAMDDSGRVTLAFPDEAPWEGTWAGDTLRFRHPVVGDVVMARA